MNIKTVSIYSEIDKQSLHVKLSDESICIGKSKIKNSYLNISNIIAAAKITNTNAIHPGYGFLSENSNFSKICKKNKIKFIGPCHEIMKKMANKINAKKIMQKNGLNIVPGYNKPIKNIKEGIEISKYIGFPIILKASEGGGGKGIRIIKEEKDFKKSWENIQRESITFFNSNEIYLEKFIEFSKHIEFQIVGNPNGTIYHLSERECTIQKKHKKLIEETPSSFITKKIRKKIGKSIIKAIEPIKYQGLGTIEFIVDNKKNFYFIEINTRIQVEHTITEELTEIDLVQTQIYISYGENKIKKNYFPKSHIIQCRINVENINNNKFKSNLDKIKNINLPGGKGIRIDTYIYNGYNIIHQYDPMIIKIIAKSKSRKNTIYKMKNALKELQIKGIKTNTVFFIKIMNNNKFISGNFTTDNIF